MAGGSGAGCNSRGIRAGGSGGGCDSRGIRAGGSGIDDALATMGATMGGTIAGSDLESCWIIGGRVGVAGGPEIA
jgi:hypothetical protein